jgi:hypothetical protein
VPGTGPPGRCSSWSRSVRSLVVVQRDNAQAGRLRASPDKAAASARRRMVAASARKESLAPAVGRPILSRRSSRRPKAGAAVKAVAGPDDVRAWRGRRQAVRAVLGGLLPSTESQRPVRLPVRMPRSPLSGAWRSRGPAPRWWSVAARSGCYAAMLKQLSSTVTRASINRPPAGRPPPSALVFPAYPEIRIPVDTAPPDRAVGRSRQG